MKQKQQYYEKVVKTVDGKTKERYIHKKTCESLYLEKHRIHPGHEGGTYKESNVVLVSFKEHIMAHYLRYLQYQNHRDRYAYTSMATIAIEERRRALASIAGSIGGKNSAKFMREQKRGRHDPINQGLLGKKGAASAREKGVGAFDPNNKIKADLAWKKKYNENSDFRARMKKNLVKGLKKQNKDKINIGNPIQQKIKSINYHGILVNNERFVSPYASYSVKSKKFQYTEARIHMSEDFFWYSIYQTSSNVE